MNNWKLPPERVATAFLDAQKEKPRPVEQQPKPVPRDVSRFPFGVQLPSDAPDEVLLAFRLGSHDRDSLLKLIDNYRSQFNPVPH